MVYFFTNSGYDYSIASESGYLSTPINYSPYNNPNHLVEVEMSNEIIAYLNQGGSIGFPPLFLCVPVLDPIYGDSYMFYHLNINSQTEIYVGSSRDGRFEYLEPNNERKIKVIMQSVRY